MTGKCKDCGTKTREITRYSAIKRTRQIHPTKRSISLMGRAGTTSENNFSIDTPERRHQEASDNGPLLPRNGRGKGAEEHNAPTQDLSESYRYKNREKSPEGDRLT